MSKPNILKYYIYFISDIQSFQTFIITPVFSVTWIMILQKSIKIYIFFKVWCTQTFWLSQIKNNETKKLILLFSKAALNRSKVTVKTFFNVINDFHFK